MGPHWYYFEFKHYSSDPREFKVLAWNGSEAWDKIFCHLQRKTDRPLYMLDYIKFVKLASE